MNFRPGNLLFCLIVAIIDYSQGIQFSLDRTADSSYCGHLQCWAHKSFTDTDIYSVVALTIYDVTNPNSTIKLASMSLFNSTTCVDKTEIYYLHVTGHIAWNSADLIVSLSDSTDCASGTYMCELDFVNIQERPEKISQTTSSGSVATCLVVKQIAEGISQIDARVSELERENSDLKQQLEKFLKDQLSQSTCARGESYNSTRKTFMLWNKIPALCDTETDGGGWIVIQRRTKGDVDFYRKWADYKNGFGTPDTDFWIGNGVINNLTSQGYTELRIDMEYNGNHYFAHYSSFQVEDETFNYRLTVTGYNGTAGDQLTYHNNMTFSTYDRDNDASGDSCAEIWHGAWWYRDCYYANLNGVWGAKDGSGIKWSEYGSRSPAVSFSEMKIRHV